MQTGALRMQRYKGEERGAGAARCAGRRPVQEAGSVWKAWACPWGVWPLSYRRQWGGQGRGYGYQCCSRSCRMVDLGFEDCKPGRRETIRKLVQGSRWRRGDAREPGAWHESFTPHRTGVRFTFSSSLFRNRPLERWFLTSESTGPCSHSIASGSFFAILIEWISKFILIKVFH